VRRAGSAAAMDDSGAARKGPGATIEGPGATRDGLAGAMEGSAWAMRARWWRGRVDKEQLGGAHGGNDGEDDPTTSYPLVSQTKKGLIPRTEPNTENGYP
jgi:hypothetical protein